MARKFYAASYYVRFVVGLPLYPDTDHVTAIWQFESAADRDAFVQTMPNYRRRIGYSTMKRIRRKGIEPWPIW